MKNTNKIHRLSQTVILSNNYRQSLQKNICATSPSLQLRVDKCTATAFPTSTQLSDSEDELKRSGFILISFIRNRHRRTIGRIYKYYGYKFEITLRVIEGRYSRYYNGHLTQPVTIHLQPIDRQIIDFIDPILDSFGRWKVSEAEYAADFHGFDVNALYKFFKEHLFLKWRHKKFNKNYRTSVYLNNVRTATTKGGKFYIKEKNGHNFVRIEVTRKRPFFCKKGLHTFYEMMAVRPTDAFRGVEFKNIDIDAVSRFLRKKAAHGEISSRQATKREKRLRSILAIKGINDAKDYARLITNRYLLSRHPFQDTFEEILENMSFSPDILWQKNKGGLYVAHGWDVGLNKDK